MDTTQAPDHTPNGFLTQQDEMSLAQERAAQTDESVPDTLEVRDDSVAILQGTLGGMRRPLLVTVVAVGATVLLAVGVSAVIRLLKQDPTAAS